MRLRDLVQPLPQRVQLLRPHDGGHGVGEGRRDEPPGLEGVGGFGWGGAYHTNYWVDPQEKLVAVFLTQLIPATGVDLQDKFRYLVYQSIVGPVPPVDPALAREKR